MCGFFLHTKQLSNSLATNSVSTVQFNSATNQLELAYTPSVKGSVPKAAPTLDASHKHHVATNTPD